MASNYEAVAAAYERLVSKEDELVWKARTCEWFMDMAIQSLIEREQELHVLTVESLLLAVQGVQEGIVVELSLTRVHKAVQAYQMMLDQRRQK